MRKVLFFLMLFSFFGFYGQQELKLLTFNIWQEGTEVPNGLQKIKDIIKDVDPDVVCFVEVRNYNDKDWTDKIVQVLSEEGEEYYGEYGGGDVSLISKYPILSSKLIYSGEGSVVNFEVKLKEREIVIAGVHLDYTYYACYLPRGYNGSEPNWKMIDDGNGNPKPIVDSERISEYNLKSERDEQIASFLNSVKDEKRPIILMGDFNEPSHLDWTDDQKNMFDHNGVVYEWESTKTMENGGFTDAYRAFFPDEMRNPGITWPSFTHDRESTSWTPKADERDRIDYIFYKGIGVSTKYASLVGPKESYVFDKLSSSYNSNENFISDSLPWPSDHKGVFAILEFSN